MPGFAQYQPGAGLAPVEVTIRAAAPADVDDLERIQEAAGRASHREHDARAIENPQVCVVVAEIQLDGGAVVVGWAKTSWLASADDAPAGHYLGGVTVDPGWRRRGIAAALTEARMQWIAERAEEAYYVVNVRNRASIDLHRRWQFEELARGPGFAGATFEGGVGLLMRADLAGARR